MNIEHSGNVHQLGRLFVAIEINRNTRYSNAESEQIARSLTMVEQALAKVSDAQRKLKVTRNETTGLPRRLV